MALIGVITNGRNPEQTWSKNFETTDVWFHYINNNKIILILILLLLIPIFNLYPCIWIIKFTTKTANSWRS